MLNGPFRKDIELIFDNAILFNSPDDWIATVAAALKKSVTKKIETASWSGEKSYKNSSGGKQRSGGIVVCTWTRVTTTMSMIIVVVGIATATNENVPMLPRAQATRMRQLPDLWNIPYVYITV
mmetsp:Transcript_19729/g.20072  ORF Transcript_19729/g.20072 Transcript_19729/m.20072 type:complete len:123 (+) Transcript_19729:969-1337(+)